MSDYELTDRQQDIVDRLQEGSLFVAAGAGSGKTTVVMEGFVEALRQKNAAIDEILTITFTEKAAGDMMRKVREILKEKEMLAERRQIENARISTIHSFCARLIRSHALILGLDPGFGVADENGANVLKQEAFDTCLESLVTDHGEEAVQLFFLVDRNRSGRLFKQLTGLHDTLCSQNRPLDFSLPEIDMAFLLKELAQAAGQAISALRAERSKATKTFDRLEQLEAVSSDADPRYIGEFLATNMPDKQKKATDEVDRVRKLCAYGMSAVYLPQARLLCELLVRFGNEYARLKREAGLLDFEDLQLQALRLLNERPEIAERVASQFRYIIVDEFQDTNHLQCEIIDRIDRGNVCFVGDENQSIYRFRHAEVELFRQKRREADKQGRLRELAENFRSQPDILSFVDFIFNREGMLNAGGYLSLDPRAKPDGFTEEARVEVMLVDQSRRAEKPNAELARKGEAELIARRLHELFSEDRGYLPGKTAILLRTRTGLEQYREALDRYGIPNYLGINKDYYKKLELGDALNLLKLLVNPLDDLALMAVLRSPMVGVSDETLLLLRLAAGKERVPLWPVMARPDNLTGLSEEERLLLTDFREELKRFRQRGRGQLLTATVREALGFRDYAVVVARDREGRQALANLLKLQDLAAAFESSWGPDLGAFVEFLQEQQESDVQEADAPTEEEGGGAVRFLTIHKSKGLEFDTVVWANMGGDGSNKLPTVLLGEDGQTGVRFKDADDRDILLFDYRELKEATGIKDLAEEKRIGYVSMTRARRRLILCGMTDLDSEAGNPAASRKHIDWVKGAFRLHSSNEELAELFARPEPAKRVLHEDASGPPVLLTICTDPEALLEEGQKLAAARATEAVEKIDQDINKLPAGAVFVQPYISPTALDTYKACPRQYYLEKVLRLGDLAGMVAPVKRTGGNGLDAAQKGTLVHALLEEVSFPPGELPDESRLLELAGRVLKPGFEFSDEDRQYIHRYLGNLAEAPVMADLLEAEKQGGMEREKQFTYLLGETIISGKMDVFARAGGRAVVVDYKTTKLSGEFDNEAAAAKYRRQMDAYAVAASWLAPGLPVKVCLLFLDQPQAEQTQVYEAADIERLKAELGEIIASMADGAFEPLPAFDRDRCVFCIGGPNRTRLCPVANGGR